MTWPMTLAGLPRAGAIFFKAPWLQTERTKNEGPSEKLSFNGEQFEFFEPKNQKIQSSYGEQNKRTTRPWRQKLNMNHVSRKKWTEAKLKKAFRIKLFELCKTRSEKSNPDLTCSTFCKLSWSCHGQWRWQGYLMQAQFQSPMITKRTYKKRRASWKNEL